MVLYPNGLRVLRDISPTLLQQIQEAGIPYRWRRWMVRSSHSQDEYPRYRNLSLSRRYTHENGVLLYLYSPLGGFSSLSSFFGSSAMMVRK
jgi:hypothetical protein